MNLSKLFLFGFAFTVLVSSCSEKKTTEPEIISWKDREIDLSSSDGWTMGSSYLSVYSQIFHRNAENKFDLTATISLRNISSADSVVIIKADYFNTNGELIRAYFDKPIVMRPLETLEIVIAEVDNHGGTGGNFIFEWAKKPDTHAPLFEAVMISTAGQQGISFTTTSINR